jgi:hypothetical protein
MDVNMMDELYQMALNVAIIVIKYMIVYKLLSFLKFMLAPNADD